MTNTTSEPSGFVGNLFPAASAELRRLYEGAAVNGGLLHTDFHTVHDLLELAGYADQEPLHALLLVMLLALDEGSPCVEASAASLARRLDDLAGEDAAQEWARRILAGLQAPGFPELIGTATARPANILAVRCIEERRPIVRCQRGDRTFLYFQKYLQHETRFREELHKRLQEGETAPPGKELSAHLRNVLVEQPLSRNGRAVRLNRDQRLALGLALLRNFAIVSGGPGTGKTSIVFTLLRCLVRAGVEPARIALAAPTGRAAQRLTDAVHSGLTNLKVPIEDTGPDAKLQELSAQTLHRLLHYLPKHGTFRHHAENPLPFDAVIVDEVSMVGMVLWAQLFQATPAATKLILLGDKDQLPSVEAGAVLASLVPADGRARYTPELCRRLTQLMPDLELSPSADAHLLQDVLVVLEENYRSQKHIQETARAVNRQDPETAKNLRTFSVALGLPSSPAPGGEELGVRGVQYPNTFAALERQAGCWLLEAAGANLADWRRLLTEWAEHQYLHAATAHGSYQALVAGCRLGSAQPCPAEKDKLDRLFELLNRARVLTLVREGAWGCAGVNRFLEQFLRPRLDPQGSAGLFAGSPVLIARNDHDRQLYNGDVGIALHDAAGAGYRVAFQRLGGYAALPADTLPARASAFALTVHKSQGSEYGQVLLVLPPDGGRKLLTKEMIYTGITRAKDLALICATRENLRFAVSRTIERESGLSPA